MVYLEECALRTFCLNTDVTWDLTGEDSGIKIGIILHMELEKIWVGNRNILGSSGRDGTRNKWIGLEMIFYGTGKDMQWN